MELDKANDKPGYVYYDNSETKWEKVYAYWWGGMAYNSVTKESIILWIGRAFRWSRLREPIFIG